ncbi:putative ABC transport system permease protein [Natronospira proteinivora]|uniref:ABC transport system permease protein n=1 Tax=Natronospira proteinivora TaxID=1807133 RepID=A0ABT1G873_9GAMM|nr:ABC transporter permease [Natronospira proteinivora]MCP1727441.1 putative ABC transport system permease protein [Natronospira proteinivora]
MNSFYLAARQLGRRPFQTLINTLVMGLGIAMVVLLLLGQSQLRERMSRDAAGIDLVVGPAGSPMQLILSSVYHVDVPIGNIPWQARDTIHRERAVAETIPLALGDNYRGFRIVGTEPAYADLYDAELREGRFWDDTLEAVLGAEVARQSGLSVGDRFEGQHGLGEGGPTHGDHPYRVVGILEFSGSVLDRLVLTPVESVWAVHNHDHDHEDNHDHAHEDDAGNEQQHADRTHEEKGDLTALLVRFASPMAATRLPTMIEDETPWQAARPAHQSARLFSMMGPAVDGLKLFAGLLVLASLLGVFALLYQNLRDRRYDLAVMRAMGGGPSLIFRLTLLEGLIMVLLGLAMGLLLGHLATGLLGQLTTEGRALMLTGWHWAEGETRLLLAVLGAGLVVALIPAWLAARTHVANTLRRGY